MKLLALVAAALSGCATVVVPRVDLPPPPVVAPGVGRTLVLDAAPEAMAVEARTLAGRAGPTAETREAIESVATVCTAARPLVLRPTVRRRHFESNAGDRNLLFSYQSARVVGLPFMLLGAGLWRWYGETVVEGRLDWADCRGTSRTLVRSFSVRSQGRGFVRGRTIEAVQAEAALRGVTRALLAAVASAGGAPPAVAVGEFVLEGARRQYREPVDLFGLVIAEEVAARLRRQGVEGEAFARDRTLEGARLVRGRFTVIDAGSRTMRHLVRFGAGAAKVEVAVDVTRSDGTVLASFPLRARMKRGAFGGSSRLLVLQCIQRLADDLARIVATGAYPGAAPGISRPPAR